jgi:hypothetical protein
MSVLFVTAADDEICSDAFPLKDSATDKKVSFEGVKPAEVEVAILKVASKKIIPNADGEIDVGCGSAFGGAEVEEDAGADSGDKPVPVIDVVHFNNLQSIPLSGPVWKAWFMDYCKTLKGKCEELDTANGNTILATRFKKNFPAIKEWGLTTILKNIDDYEFYVGKSSDFPQSNKSLLIPAKYEGEAVSPDFYFLVDGIEIQKC